MNKEEAIAKLKDLQNSGDTESAHSQADNVLCGLLVSLGFPDVVDEFQKIDKWYA